MMDAFHHLHGTTGPQPPRTRQPDRLPAHSSRPQQSPPRTAADDGAYRSHQELPATAVQDAPFAELTIPSACSYQHLHTVLLQRPIESKLAFHERGEPPCAYVTEAIARRAKEVEHQIEELTRFKRELDRLYERTSAQSGREPEPDRYCHIIESGK